MMTYYEFLFVSVRSTVLARSPRSASPEKSRCVRLTRVYAVETKHKLGKYLWELIVRCAQDRKELR